MPVDRPLGDTSSRSYSLKLDRFTDFIAPELERVVADFDPPARAAVLDLGCGTGLATTLLAKRMGSEAMVIGLDLSQPHLAAARLKHELPLVQADAERLCFREAVFDLIWCCNTLNHFKDMLQSARALRRALLPGGRLALAQSSFLPEMFFAWDAPLDDAVRAACHRYYRERYGLRLSDTAGIRALVGVLRAAGFLDVTARTHVIERIQPVSQGDRDYFREAVFEGLWGERLRPYLEDDLYERLERYCDASSPDYCLDRPDFHHIQTLTVCTGRR